MKDIFELVEQVIKKNTGKNNVEKTKLLIDIQKDFGKFKYVELDYSNLFKILSVMNVSTIREIMKLDLTEKFYSMRWEFSTPKAIITLAKKLLDIKENDKVLDICSGIGDF